MKKYFIITDHSIHIDDYKQGELNWIDGYITDGHYSAENPNEAIQKHFESLGLPLDIAKGKFESSIFHYSNLVDSENISADDEDIERWKNGKKALYSNTTQTQVFELTEIVFN